MAYDCPNKDDYDNGGMLQCDSPKKQKTMARRVFALKKTNVEENNEVVVGTIPTLDLYHLCWWIQVPLIYISHNFIKMIEDLVTSTPSSLSISTLSDDIMHFTRTLKGIDAEVKDKHMSEELHYLNMQGFDVILWIDWLTKYNDVMMCRGNKMIFEIPKYIPFSFKGTSSSYVRILISAL